MTQEFGRSPNLVKHLEIVRASPSLVCRSDPADYFLYSILYRIDFPATSNRFAVSAPDWELSVSSTGSISPQPGLGGLQVVKLTASFSILYRIDFPATRAWLLRLQS